MNSEPPVYSCRIVAWLDGDTCDVMLILPVVVIDTTVTVEIPERVRIDGINAPERHSADRAERFKGETAKDHAEKLAPAGSVVKVESASHRKPREKYGRWLGKLTLVSGSDFAAEMIGSGHATEYHGENR